MESLESLGAAPARAAKLPREKQKFHGAVEWFGLEGTFGITQFQPLPGIWWPKAAVSSGRRMGNKGKGPGREEKGEGDRQEGMEAEGRICSEPDPQPVPETSRPRARRSRILIRAEKTPNN